MNATLKNTLTALAMTALVGTTVGCGDKSSETPEGESTSGAEAAPAEPTGDEAMPPPEGEEAPAPEGEPPPSP